MSLVPRSSCIVRHDALRSQPLPTQLRTHCEFPTSRTSVLGGPFRLVLFFSFWATTWFFALLFSVPSYRALRSQLLPIFVGLTVRYPPSKLPRWSQVWFIFVEPILFLLLFSCSQSSVSSATLRELRRFGGGFVGIPCGVSDFSGF